MTRDDLSSLPAAAWLTTTEAAAVLGLKPATLHRWRCVGDGRLQYHRSGRVVRYLRGDLDRFLAGTNDAGAR